MSKRKLYKFHWYGSQSQAERVRQELLRNRKSLTSKNLIIVAGTVGHQPAYALTATSKKSIDVARNYLNKKPHLKHK